MKCANIERGCEWVGTVATLEEHVATCEFTLLPCPKQCKDDKREVKSFMRKDLDKHLKEDCPFRNYACEYCGKMSTYVIISRFHDKKCPKKILPCPNAGCTNTMQYQHIEEHVTLECDHTIVPCKYKGLGCETELKRKDMTSHEEDDKLHLHMAINTTAKLEKQLEKTLNKIDTLEINMKDALAKIYMLELATPRNSTKNEHMVRVTGYQIKKDCNTRYQSPSFYTSPEGYNMAIRVDANGSGSGKDTHMSVFAIFLKGDNDDKLSWPFVGNITITLLNQLEDKNHFRKTLYITAIHNKRAGTSQNSKGYREFILHSELGYNPGKNTQYLKDDNLCFRVSVTIVFNTG